MTEERGTLKAPILVSGASIAVYSVGGKSNTRATDTLTDSGADVERMARLAEALKPFADCCDQIADEESDEEWAKFRLLVGDYRRARAAIAALRSPPNEQATAE